MPRLLTAPPLFPQVELPEDRNLPEFSHLFDSEWVWRTFRSWLGEPDERPQCLRLRQLSYNPGRSAIATCVAEWPWDEFVTQEQFAVELARDQPARLYSYPNDPHLPGLTKAASSVEAVELLREFVLAASVQRVRVQMVRYRPGGHAVLRYRHGGVRFYVRVMQPRRVSRLLAAAEVVAQSGFTLPRLAGCWAGGGVVWFSEIPGKNVRKLIRRGNRPDPEPILANVERLWDLPYSASGSRPFNLLGGYRRARRVFRQVLRDREGPRRALREATAALDPFVTSWRPSGIAHNDFYDDQMIRIPDGRLALVDFEEAGPGDPLLDVGNFLAHMRWSARFGRDVESKASGEYHQMFRSLALERFGWEERELNLREAVCLLRVCTNPIRHLAPDWLGKVQAGLTLVNEVLA